MRCWKFHVFFVVFHSFHFFTTDFNQTAPWLQHGTRAPLTAAGTACSAGGSQRRWRAPGTIVTCWWSVKPRATEWKAWVFTRNLVGFLPVFTMAPFNFGITGLAHWLTSLRNMKVVQFVEFVSTFHNLCSSRVEMTTRSRFGTTSCEGVSSHCLAIWITSEPWSSMMTILGSWVHLMIKPFVFGIGNPDLALQCWQVIITTWCVPISIPRRTWWSPLPWIKQFEFGTHQVYEIRP